MADIEKALLPMRDIHEKLLQTMAPVAEAMARLTESMEPILRVQQELVSFAIRISEQSNTLQMAMQESGWWFTPSLLELPASRLDSAAESHKQGNLDAITDLFKETYQKEDCKNLELVVVNWQQNPFFVPWQKHLTSALSSHKAGDYELSVPTLLLASEGIATEFCKSKNIYDPDDQSKGGIKITKAIEESYGVPDHPMYSAALLLKNAISATIYKNTDKLNGRLETDILNRHAVLHGLKPDYGTEKASLQAFMLLDLLSELK